jgi:predicted secreted protein
MARRPLFVVAAIAAAELTLGGTLGFMAYPAAANEVSAPAPAPARAPAATDRICIKSEITGSRIARKVCQTRAEWIAQYGVDPTVTK